MISAHLHVALAVALLLLPSVAAADDGGDDAGETDASSTVMPDASSFVDGPVIACDGALCEAPHGSTCDVGSTSVGVPAGHTAGHTLTRTNPEVSGAIGLLALVVTRRRARSRDGRRAGRGAQGRSPSWAAPPRPPGAPN
jgi:hypothetical protein